MEQPAYPSAVILNENLNLLNKLIPCFDINTYANYYAQNFQEKYKIEDFSEYFEFYEKQNQIETLFNLLNNGQIPPLPNKYQISVKSINGQMKLKGLLNQSYYLDFDLETGLEEWAENVIIPEKEIVKMLESSLIKVDDFQQGGSTLKLQSGQIIPSRYFTIKEIMIDSLKVKNVLCEIGSEKPYDKAILGKSFKKRFYIWEMDSSKKIIHAKIK
jgi:hypothetical protein